MGLTEKQKKNLPIALQKAILAKQKAVKKMAKGGVVIGDELKQSYKDRMKILPVVNEYKKGGCVKMI